MVLNSHVTRDPTYDPMILISQRRLSSPNARASNAPSPCAPLGPWLKVTIPHSEAFASTKKHERLDLPRQRSFYALVATLTLLSSSSRLTSSRSCGLRGLASIPRIALIRVLSCLALSSLGVVVGVMGVCVSDEAILAFHACSSTVGLTPEP
jgi:hypothetical protein